mgnify:CR=1 FL=1|jgi:hypothetical protein
MKTIVERLKQSHCNNKTCTGLGCITLRAAIAKFKAIEHIAAEIERPHTTINKREFEQILEIIRECQ